MLTKRFLIARLGLVVVVVGTQSCVSISPHNVLCAEDGRCPGGTECDFASHMCVAEGTAECVALPCREPDVRQLVARHFEQTIDQLDLLMIIDNSGSMEEEQDNMLSSIGGFFDHLSVPSVGLPGLHLGVITTDIGARNGIADCRGDGDNGVLQRTGDNCVGPDGSFIEDIPGPGNQRITNYDGTLVDAFSCIATLGTGGCGFEQTLEAMHRALNGQNPQNEGFLRNDAVLGIFVLSDEDDCSTHNNIMFDNSNSAENELGPLSSFRCFEFGVTCDETELRQTGPRSNCRPRTDSPYMHPITRYVDFLRSLKTNPDRMIVLGGATGDVVPVSVGIDNTGTEPKPALNPTCETVNGLADPGIRLHSLMGNFSHRGIGSICGDLSEPLIEFARDLQQVMGTRCMSRSIQDVDATQDGVQGDCIAEQIGPTSGEITSIPVCSDPSDPENSSSLPCYLISQDTDLCTELQGLAFDLHGMGMKPPGSQVQLRCRL